MPSSPAENFCTLYLVRHGESLGNKKRLVTGHDDQPLTPLGIQQAENLAKKLKEVHFDAIFSSDLLRARRTAEIVGVRHGVEIITSKSLRERTLGRFDGMLREDYEKEVGHLLKQAKEMSSEEQWSFKVDKDSENQAELNLRFVNQLREIAASYPGKTVLVVTHGGCIRNFLIHAGYLAYDELPNGAIQTGGYVKVLYDEGDFRVQEVEGLKKS